MISQNKIASVETERALDIAMSESMLIFECPFSIFDICARVRSDCSANYSCVMFLALRMLLIRLPIAMISVLDII